MYGFTGIYTVRGSVSTNLAYQLTLPSPTAVPVYLYLMESDDSVTVHGEDG